MSDWKRMKWLPVGAGALLCVLGLASLLWPAALVRLLPILIGLAVLVLGTAEIAYRLAMRAAGDGGGPPLLQGAAALAVGLVLLLNRDVSMVFMGLVLGLWALISAGFRLHTLVQLRRAGLPWGSVALDAGLKLLLAVFMLARPVKTMTLWAQLVGVFFLIIGVSVIVSALYFDRAFRDRDDF